MWLWRFFVEGFTNYLSSIKVSLNKSQPAPQRKQFQTFVTKSNFHQFFLFLFLCIWLKNWCRLYQMAYFSFTSRLYKKVKRRGMLTTPVAHSIRVLMLLVNKSNSSHGFLDLFSRNKSNKKRLIYKQEKSYNINTIQWTRILGRQLYKIKTMITKDLQRYRSQCS